MREGPGDEHVAQRDQEDPDRDHQLEERAHRAADGGRRGLGEIERDDERRDADPEAEREAAGGQQGQRGKKRRERRRGREDEAREDQAALAAEEPREDPREQGAEDSAGRQDRGVALLVMNRELIVLGQRVERVGDEPLVQAEEQAAERGYRADDVDDGLVPMRCTASRILCHRISLSCPRCLRLRRQPFPHVAALKRAVSIPTVGRASSALFFALPPGAKP